MNSSIEGPKSILDRQTVEIKNDFKRIRWYITSAALSAKGCMEFS